MLERREFSRGFLVAVCACTVAAATAQVRYVPENGDLVEIYRHPFGTKNFAKGKAEYLKAMTPRLVTDGLVRMTIMAENTVTGEMVSVQFSDPYNAAKGSLRPHVQHIYKLHTQPRREHSFRIYAHNNESHVPAVGDHLIFWWRKVDKKDHKHMRGLVMSKVIAAARKDSQNRDSYFLENDVPGEFLSMAISAPTSGSTTSIRSVFASIDSRLLEPLKVEQYRVFFVRHENKR